MGLIPLGHGHANQLVMQKTIPRLCFLISQAIKGQAYASTIPMGLGHGLTLRDLTVMLPTGWVGTWFSLAGEAEAGQRGVGKKE